MQIAHLVRKVSQHLFLGPTENERLGKTFEQFPLVIIHFRSVDVFVPETGPGTQKPRIDELHQVPEFSHMILHRRSRKNQPASGLERHRSL